MAYNLQNGTMDWASQCRLTCDTRHLRGAPTCIPWCFLSAGTCKHTDHIRGREQTRLHTVNTRGQTPHNTTRTHANTPRSRPRGRLYSPGCHSAILDPENLGAHADISRSPTHDLPSPQQLLLHPPPATRARPNWDLKRPD